MCHRLRNHFSKKRISLTIFSFFGFCNQKLWSLKLCRNWSIFTQHQSIFKHNNSQFNIVVDNHLKRSKLLFVSTLGKVFDTLQPSILPPPNRQSRKRRQGAMRKVQSVWRSSSIQGYIIARNSCRHRHISRN